MLDFPKDRRANLEWRTQILRRCKDDEEYRAKIKELYYRNILFAFNAFFYTFDVRKKPQYIPFMTWDFQDKAILDLASAIGGTSDRVIEKSRDMGATWIILATFYWFWSKPDEAGDFLIGSRIEDYVDRKGDMRALFPKLRFIHHRMPRWLWPEGFQRRQHDLFQRLINPETGGSITGESNNPNFSTAGRYKAIMYDEFAKWEGTDEAAWTAGGDASPCRIANSTPFGAGGKFYNLVTDGRTKRIQLHWSLHPEKSLGIGCIWPPPNEADKVSLGESWTPEEVYTSPWYESECLRRTPTEIAQELDMDFLGAGRPVFDGKAMLALKYYHKVPEKPLAWCRINLEDIKLETEEREPLSTEGYLVVYDFFDFKHAYAIGVDVVEGVEGGDYASICVLDRMTKDVAAFYWSQIDEVMLSRVAKAIGDYYSPEPDSAEAPWIGIETTGPGLATFDLSIMLGMSNLFMAPRYDVTNGTVSYKKGWRTDTNSRNELISGVRQYLIDRAGRLNSQRLVGELLSFVRSRTGKAQAKEGCHDDCVFSFGIALQVDELAPLDYESVREARPKVSLRDHVEFDREDHRIEEDTSLEARCYSSLLIKKFQEEKLEDEFYGEA